MVATWVSTGLGLYYASQNDGAGRGVAFAGVALSILAPLMTGGYVFLMGGLTALFVMLS